MRAARPGVNEGEIEALIDYTFRRRGGTGPGYPTIVGGGVNATILHYVENNAPLAAGQLLLVDAGCEIDGYTADVTRTFPVGGRFSEPQRRLYETVLEAQVAAIEAVKPGATIDAIHEQVLVGLTRGLLTLGLLEGRADDVPKLVEDGAYKPFYMHRTSHWLGIDVHDVGFYSQEGVARPLEPGMVLTIEPGLDRRGRRQRSRRVPRARRAHRGRHPRDPERPRQPHARDAQVSERDREADRFLKLKLDAAAEVELGVRRAAH
jgi:Xaa-Pro aminopeptidase